MNKLEISISEPDKHGERKAILLIDGRELLDIVRDIERPIAKLTSEATLAGGYDYLNADDVLPPSEHLLGKPARPLLEYAGRISILECECGFEGCWPLTLSVIATDNIVEWFDFRQVHRDNWKYPSDFRFEFDRKQIEAALETA